MTETYHHQKNRLIALILVTLLGFNGAVAWYLYSEQRQQLHQSAATELSLQARMVAGFLRDPLLRHDYAQARHFLSHWKDSHPQLQTLSVQLDNQPPLFEHHQPPLSGRFITQRHQESVGHWLLTVQMEQDLSLQQQSLRSLIVTLTALALGATLLFAAILWVVLSRWILTPLSEEIKNQTAQISRLNHAYKALSESNMALLTAQSEEQLLQEVCEVISRSCGYPLVWIGYAKSDHARSLQVMAQAGEDGGYLKALDLCWQDAPCGQSPAASAIRQKASVVIQSIAREADGTVWGEAALKRGFQSGCALAILHKRHIVAALEVYSQVEAGFTRAQMALLGELADNLAFGIAALRDRQRVETLSVTDPLTGLANRNRISGALIAQRDLADRYHEPFSVVLMDLDHFKSVNDTYGHQKGDEVLQGFAAILEKNRRKSDLMGRWGGEEFIAILPKNDAAAASFQAERIRQQVEKSDFGLGRAVTASFGVATAKADESTDQLLQRADEALYRAKGAGRNRVVCT